MNFRSPTLITLAVHDLEKSLAFYRDTLHVPLKLRVGTMAELQTETFLLVLVEGRAADDNDQRADGVSLGWDVDDLENASVELQELGVTLDAVEDNGPRGRRRAFRDPDGYRLEIVEMVAQQDS